VSPSQSETRAHGEGTRYELGLMQQMGMRMNSEAQSDDRNDEEPDQAPPDHIGGGLEWQDDWGATTNYFGDQRNSEILQRLLELAAEAARALGELKSARGCVESEEPREVSAGRDWVEDFYAKGLDELDRQYLQETCNYRHSTEHTVCQQTQKLKELIERYDEAFRDTDIDRDFVTEEVLRRNIEVLVKQLVATVTKLQIELAREAQDEAMARDGRLADDARIMRAHRRGISQQKSRTSLEGAGIGMAPGDLGEVADQTRHILEDSQADDDGEMRQLISQKIRSMPRWLALRIIEQAVMDGVMSRITADYLIRECVRSR